MSIGSAVAAVAAALEAAGLRVALRSGDITPPVVYVRIQTLTEAGMPLSGGLMIGFYLYYIPVRGLDNLTVDAADLDAIFEALSPLAAGADLTAIHSSVTVNNDTWPAYRVDLTALSVQSFPTLEAAHHAD